MAKGHVIYEGKSGHIVSYDGMFLKYCYFRLFLSICVMLSHIIYYFINSSFFFFFFQKPSRTQEKTHSNVPMT